MLATFIGTEDKKDFTNASMAHDYGDHHRSIPYTAGGIFSHATPNSTEGIQKVVPVVPNGVRIIDNPPD